MKNFHLLFWLLLLSRLAYSQSDKSKSQTYSGPFDINPTKVFSIEELDSKNKTNLLIERGQVKDIEFVDHQSLIKVVVDQEKLAKTLEFVGNISISATLNNREIRVQGYSAVGEESVAIGVNGISSTKDFASSLLGLISEIDQFNSSIFCDSKDLFEYYLVPLEGEREISNSSTPYASIQSFVKEIEDIVTYLKSDTTLTFIKITDLLSNNLKSEISNRSKLSDDSKLPKELAISQLNRLKNTYEGQITAYNSNATDIEKKYRNLYFALQLIKQRLPLLVNYFSYLSQSNTETSRAFSKAIRRDPIFVQFITEKMISSASRYDSIFDSFIKNYNDSDQSESEIKIKKSIKDLNDIIQDIDYVIQQLRDVRYQILIDINENYDSLINQLNLKTRQDVITESENGEYGFCLDGFYYLFQSYYDQRQIRDKYVQDLTTSAGYYIYKKLIPGIIDLEYENAKVGDRLDIYVDWFNPSGERLTNEGKATDVVRADDKPLRYLIGSFKIKKVGWSVKIADSFLLVDRLNIPRDTADVSPSKFKGAPGITLLYSYGDNGSSNGLRRTLKSIEPSIGINVSYLDFDRTKDVEIGTGISVGLFNNLLFFNYGVNLNVDDARSYFGLGLSFANLGSSFKKNEE